jgi:hypothetical protein
MPLQHGRRFDQDHGVDRLRPNSVEKDPKQPVRVEESHVTSALSLQDA